MPATLWQLQYRLAVATVVPPLPGEIREDSTNPATVMLLWIHHTSEAGEAGAILAALLAGDVLRISETADPTRNVWWELTANAVDHDDYTEVPVALRDSSKTVGAVPVDLLVASYGSPLSAQVYASRDQLAAAVRVQVTGKNADLLDACVAAASAEIEHECGRSVDDPIPVDDPLAHMTCIARGVEWYKANDAAFGALGFDNTGVLTAPVDGFARHAPSLVPLKVTFGIA